MLSRDIIYICICVIIFLFPQSGSNNTFLFLPLLTSAETMKETGKSRSRSSVVDRSNEILAHSGHVPAVPSPRNAWIGAIICHDFFWRDAKKRDRCAHPPSDGRLRFIRPEPRVEDRRNIDENSVLRFRNERKELPLSESQFSHPK